MSVHYKFKSSLEYDTVTFDGLHITVSDLKKAIIQQKRIGKNTDFDLQVTNAQTKEVFTDENTLIPKNTSLIIARVPLVQQGKARQWNAEGQVFVGSARTDDIAPAVPLSKAADLSRLDASEDDKIRAMISQSTQDYDPSNYMKIRGASQMGEVPPNYRCFKCHQPGHWIKNCPLGLNQDPVEIKKSTGIPRSFMVPVEGPTVPGVRVTPTGQYAVPALDHQAYNSTGTKNTEDMAPEQQLDIPEDLLCSICKDLLADAVMIPCCGQSFCDECIRTILLESEDHECPDCHERDISPGTLIPNRFLRTSVSNFKNETGYRKRPQHRYAAQQQRVASVQQPDGVTTTVDEKKKIEKIELPDFVPPPENDPNFKPEAVVKQPDQKPIISEADSTDQTRIMKTEEVKTELARPAETTDGPPGVDSPVKPFAGAPIMTTGAQVSNPITNLGNPIQAVHSGVPQSVNVPQRVQLDHIPSVQHVPVKQPVPPGAHPNPGGYSGPRPNPLPRPQAPIQHQIPVTGYVEHRPQQQMEERPGTPTVDEPGVGQPFSSGEEQRSPFVSPPPGTVPPTIQVPQGPPPAGLPPRPHAPPVGYPPGQTGPPRGYGPPPIGPGPPFQPPPFGAPPPVRGPPAPADYNPHIRPFAPGFDQHRPPPGSHYDAARPPPPFQGYPPRVPPPGPRGLYGPPPRHHGVRPPFNGNNPPGVIDDPLAAFERMLREKDERDRRAREARRSHSRSYSPRSRSRGSSGRSRSPSYSSPPPRRISRSHSRSIRSSRSRSPPPRLKRRSRTPRSRSPIPPRHPRRSRSPRSRSRSFTISRSRSFSRSPSFRGSPREYSPRRRPPSRGRYRSPLPPRQSPPPRFRYKDRAPPPEPNRDHPRERDRNPRGGGGPPDREYNSYYEGPSFDYGYDRDRERVDRRDREHDRDRIDRDNRGRDIDRPPRDRGPIRSVGPAPVGPRVPPQRYLPPPQRKEYPLGIMPPQQQYYSIQEHAVLSGGHHGAYQSGPPPPINRYPPREYPPSLMSVKTAPPAHPEPLHPIEHQPPPRVASPAPRSYEPYGNVVPPGTEQPTVPGFESPRLDSHNAAAISEAPPGVDPFAGDTVITKPIIEREREERSKDRGKDTDRERDRTKDADRDRDRDRKERDHGKRSVTPERKHKHSISPIRNKGESRHSTPDRHKRHRRDSVERDRRTSDTKMESDRDRRSDKKSTEDDKSRDKKSKDKKKRKKEKDAEKSKKRKEKRERKEQEKIKKAGEKKHKDDTENSEKVSSHVSEKNEGEKHEKHTSPGKKEKAEGKADDLYGDILSEGVDAKVVENYGKLQEGKTETEQTSEILDKPEEANENEERDTSFDGLEIQANDNDLHNEGFEVSSKTKKDSAEVLAPLPELSKWEKDDEQITVAADNKDGSEGKLDIKSVFEKPVGNKIVTSEVLKHAENAIFKKAINAIRPIEIKKISVDRAKLYSGEKSVEPSKDSPAKIEKESPVITSNIQVTIPTDSNNWEARLVDINPPQPEQQKTPPVRLSVRERLGSKVEDLDKITKDEKPYDRNRSRTLSPLSRREREEAIRMADRRRVEIDDRRKVESRHDGYNRGRYSESERRGHMGPESRGRNYREYHRRDHRRDDRRDDERREHSRMHSDTATKSLVKRPEKKERIVERHKDDKHKKRTKRSRSRSESREKKSDKDKRKKKDKRHKKEKEKSKKHKKEDDSEENKKSETKSVKAEEKKEESVAEKKETTEKKIVERRKPTLDESNFEPDYDALESESDGEDKPKNESSKKRDRSKSSENAGVDETVKKRKTDDAVSKKKAKESSSSSESSSDSSSSEEERHKKKHKKHKKHKKRNSSSSSSESDSESSSEDEKKSKKNKTRKHKNKKSKKKKKSKHR